MPDDDISSRLERAVADPAAASGAELAEKLVVLCAEALPAHRPEVVAALRGWLEVPPGTLSAKLHALTVAVRLQLRELLPAIAALTERTARFAEDSSQTASARRKARHALAVAEIALYSLTERPARAARPPEAPDPVFERIKGEIERERDAGIVTVRLRRRLSATAPATAEFMHFCHELRFSSEAAVHLRRIGREAARAALRRVLERDLAYGEEVMPPPVAERLAGEFLDRFGADADFFTNADEEIEGRWIGLTPSRFDSGVFALDAERVGCVWVQDED